MNGDGFEKPLTVEEEREARQLAAVAERAEARAREREAAATHAEAETTTKFLTKQQRQAIALQKLEQKRMVEANRANEAKVAHDRFVTGQAARERARQLEQQKEEESRERARREREENKLNGEREHEVKTIRDHYLGGQEKVRKVAKPSEKSTRFKFNWEAGEDTMKDDHNPLYTNRTKINALFGRGYIAGVDQREQRKSSNYLDILSEKRQDISGSSSSASDYHGGGVDVLSRKRQREDRDDGLGGKHWSDKDLGAMTDRDWRIFREDFDIRIQGGRATLPLRSWEEARLPPVIMRAISDAGYEKPSPIQRQAIPVGLVRRDMIGIAETGSGKTAAFLIPLLCYMARLPSSSFERVAEQGPLALVMAPVRELAQQIEEECIKLARHTKFSTVCVVGGQSIEEQGYILRRGVDICIGTPGRLRDCLNGSFMVLNQCNYVVLDEADRMIDMGFGDQVTEILDSMGGLLKSEDEQQAEGQEQQAERGEALFRVTAMFSATMPREVEQIAKTYLRHPAIIKIGDQDSGKNARIEQVVVMLTESQKRSRIIEDLKRLKQTDKIIVFVNIKKNGDSVGKLLEGAGFAVGVLHGGKSQDQREETLESFRSGRIQVLVATDVAGRGLDIPDVTHGGCCGSFILPCCVLLCYVMDFIFCFCFSN